MRRVQVPLHAPQMLNRSQTHQFSEILRGKISSLASRDEREARMLPSNSN